VTDYLKPWKLTLKAYKERYLGDEGKRAKTKRL